MLKVLGRANSINVQKVMWCIAELGLPHIRFDIGGAYGKNNETEYLGKNPNGTIPTLIDDEFILWESNSIVRYLCEKYKTLNLCPPTIKSKGLANQWMDWYLSTLHAHMTVIFWQLIRTSDDMRDNAAIESSRVDAIKLWTIVDHHLKSNDYMIGENITMADIPIGCAAYRWYSLDIKRPDLNYLNRWRKKLSERVAYQEHVMLPLT